MNLKKLLLFFLPNELFKLFDFYQLAIPVTLKWISMLKTI